MIRILLLCCLLAMINFQSIGYDNTRFNAAIHHETQVYDGDTVTEVLILIKAHDFSELPIGELGDIWPTIALASDGIYTKNSVRLKGIDTPELRPRRAGRSELSLNNEKQAAEEARDALRTLLTANGNRLTLTDVSLDKYGRILAVVFIGNTDAAGYLIAQGHGIPYDGGTKTTIDWENR